MNSAVEEIKSRVDIADIIGEYIKLQKAGANWKAPCPFHNEKTPSFVVSDEKQIWHCFGCGKGGDAFGFLMELEGIEFKEALKILADKAGVELPSYDPKTAGTKNKTLEILELATKFYEKQLWSGDGKGKILDYLHKRGLKDEPLRIFQIGYAPSGWRNMLEFLTERGYEEKAIMETGLLVDKGAAGGGRYYDRFRDRIIFPISDPMGKVVGFSARVAPGGDESQAKYVNTPETSVYHKSKVLYGINNAKIDIKNKDFVLLVEGNTDVIAAYQTGIKNTVAVSGTALTPEQLDILKRYTENIKMLFDMDEAGQVAALKSAQLAFQKDLNAFIVKLEGGKDAAEIVAKDPNELLEAIGKSVPAMEYFYENILKKYDKTKAQGKKFIAKEILNIIGNISNEIEKSHWIKKLSKELEVEENIVADILDKNKPKRKNIVSNETEEKNGETGKKRMEIIRDKMIGLMMVDGDVWRKISDREQDRTLDFLKKDNLFSILVEKGSQTDFKFDNILSEISDEEMIDCARKLHFDTKYQFDTQQGINENDSEDNWDLAQQYLSDIKKEICRERLEIISKDLKKAESSGDKDAAKFLTKEFSEISQELNC